MQTLVEFCLIAGILSGTHAIAQAPSTPTDASPPTLKVHTRLTIEYVTVTDAKGMPVHGLTQADFFVKEDGRQQAIKNFEEHGVAKAASEGGASSQSLSGRPASPQPAAAVAGASTVLMFDLVTGGSLLMQPPEQLDYARKQSEVFLKTMPAGTKVAVLELGSVLRLVQGFTSDREELLKAVDSIHYRPIEGTYVIPPVWSEHQLCEAANNQSQLVLNALGYAAGGLSHTEGRKNLIWFTPGIRWLTDYRLFNRSACLNDYTPQLHEAYARLAAAQVVLYPMDPRGVVLNEGVLFGAQSAASLRAFSVGVFDQNNSLKYLADATGGKAYWSRNDLAVALGEVVASGSDYYALAYATPPSKREKYHSIKIAVDRPALKLEYREGYTSVDEKTAQSH